MNVLTAADPAALPALVSAAAAALSQAKTSAQVLEARVGATMAYTLAKQAARLQKIKGAHGEMIGTARRLQGDALKIEARANIRLADEYDAAQERGEVAKHGQKRADVPDGNISNDLGLTRKDIHEARLIRDAEEAEPGIVERTILERLEFGEEPLRSEIRKAIVDAATRGGKRRATKSRRNPLYVAPTPEQAAIRWIVGEAYTTIEEYGGWSMKRLVSGFEEDKVNDLRALKKYRDFLTRLLEAAK